MSNCLFDPVCDWRKGEHSMVCAEQRNAVYTHEDVKAMLLEEMALRYHPEFGSEWQEDGSLGRLIREAQEDAFWEGVRAAVESGTWSAIHNPYSKES